MESTNLGDGVGVCSSDWSGTVPLNATFSGASAESPVIVDAKLAPTAAS